jgi:hypothetical protein
MARQIGGFSLEGRYFIVQVPDEWKEMDPLPDPSPADLWFDHVTEFKAALRGPWIRRPVRRIMWGKRTRATKPATSLRRPSRSSPPMLTMEASQPAARAFSRSLGDLTESHGGIREVAARLGQQQDA